jgi:hypothetical protein
MAILDFSGEYLNYESSNDGDICEILDECKEEYNTTLKKTMSNMHIKKNDKTMIYTPSNAAGKILQAAFGADSKDWIGQKFQIVHADKKMLIRPIKVTKI